MEIADDQRISLKASVDARAVDRARDWIEQAGGRVVSRPAEEAAPTAVLVADVPVDRLHEMAEQDWVRRMEHSRALFTRLDKAHEHSGRAALRALGPPDDVTGDGVLVGVVDSGVDWSHPAFRDAGGGSRIERFTHARLDDSGDTSVYDSFDTAEIDAAIAGTNTIPVGDPGGHGTHCASIAVGGGDFEGVAPGAALYAMRSDDLLDDQIIAGIQEAFSLAGDRPCVVSLSLGSHAGGHDASSLIEEEIDNATGPGRIVVVAAGNEAGDGIHAQGELQAGVELLIPFTVTDPVIMWIEAWMHRGDEVDVFLEDPGGGRHGPSDELVAGPHGEFFFVLLESPTTGDSQAAVQLMDGMPGDLWHLVIEPVGAPLNGEVHAWGQAATGNRDIFPNPTDPAYTLGVPGTAERAITVGACVSRTGFDGADGPFDDADLVAGQLAPFSSHGPTRLGSHKPDIVAPGQYLVAALSSGSDFEQFTARRSATPGWIGLEGTSMATPYVAGVVAMMLEINPTLGPEQVRQLLRLSARRTPTTGGVWNAGWGWGDLDVEQLIERVRRP